MERETAVKISCPSCQAKYSIADEKVQDRLAKIRCRKCGTTIVIDGKVSPASVYAADAGADAGAEGGSAAVEQVSSSAGAQAAASSGSPEYTVDFGDNDQRTMGLAQVVAAYNAGEITAETYVWAEGFADWTPLGQVGEIVEALHAAAGGTAPTAAAETPWQEPAAAAAAAPSGTDLFGSYDRAGSEDDVDLATSALGASPAPAPRAPTGGSATGARNESSVLFSLSALTSAASNSKPSVAAPSSPGVTEDSGLIDLKALTAAAASVGDSPLGPSPGLGAPSPLGGAPLGMAPLGGGMPLGGVATAMDISMPQAQGKSRNGLFIAGGIVVAAVAVTLIIQLTGGKEPVAPAQVAPTPVATVATADPGPTPAKEPEPAPSAETEAKPPATGTAAEEEPPAPTATAQAKPQVTKKKATTSSTSSTSSSSTSGSSAAPAPAPAPKPATPTNKCGCKAGDLQCAMRCAAGG